MFQKIHPVDVRWQTIIFDRLLVVIVILSWQKLKFLSSRSKIHKPFLKCMYMYSKYKRSLLWFLFNVGFVFVLKLNKFIILVTLVYTYSYMRYLEVCYEKKHKFIEQYSILCFIYICLIRKTIQPIKCIREVCKMDVFFIEYWFYWFSVDS